MNQPNSSSALLGQALATPLQRIAMIAAGVAVIAIAGKIQVPFWPVPMTLTTLAIMAIFAMSGLRLSLEIIFAYLAAGFAGLPVFAGALAGPAYFVGPTGGFLLGFVAAAIIVGWAADRGLARNPLSLFGAMLVGDIAVFALGFLWLGFLFTTSSGTTLGAEVAFNNGVKPFVLADLTKIAVAAALVTGIARTFKRD